MQNSKRTFLKNIAKTSAALVLPNISISQKTWERVEQLTPQELASDGALWQEIRQAYRLKPDYINLENGYYSMQAQPVLEAFVNHAKEVNYQASYYMRTQQVDDKINMRKKLSAMLGCTHEELAITRNTTESVDIIVSGIDWKAGDEAIMAEQDYGSLVNMFKQQEKRYGIVNKILSVPNHPKSDEEIVDLYEKAITPKTRLIMVSHMINITGHILPIKKNK